MTAIEGRLTRFSKEERAVRSLAGVREALSRLRGVGSLDRLLEMATQVVCRSCGFERAALARIEDSHLMMESIYFTEDREWGERLMAIARAERPRLAYRTQEADISRRRAPALVLDPQNDPHAIRLLVEGSRTRSYVAAPIMPGGEVIGMIHADRYFSGEDVDALDREVLATFAEGFGYVVERTLALEQTRATSARLRELADSAETVDVGLVAATGGKAVRVPRRTVESVTFPELTPRETDVLELLVRGETNAEIATKLAISEGTVKSHVKHLLRKVGAANRAEAVARYLGARDAANGR